MAPEADPEKLKRARALQLKMKMAAATEVEPEGGPFRGAGASGDWGYPDPGPAAAMGTKFIQGTTKESSDEGVGLLARAKFDAGPGRYLRLPDGSELPATTPEQLQFAAREYERQNQAAAEQHWPKLGFLANVAGEVAGDVALAGRKVISPLYQAAAGTARGYFGSKSDDPISQGASATIGGLLGYGAGKAPELAAAASQTRLAQAIANSRAGRATGEALSSAVRWPGEALERLGVRTGRRVLSGAKGLKAEEALPDEAIREAMDSGAIQPFGTTAGASRRLTAVREQVGGEMGRVVDGLEQRGVRGPSAIDIYHELANEAAARRGVNTADAVPNFYQDQAEAIFARGGDDLRLGITQTNDMTGNLQRAAKYGKFEETPLNEARRDVARRVRGRLGESVERARTTSADPETVALAGQFEPLKSRLSRLIPADDHAYQEANRIASRSPVSLFDMMAAGGTAAATQSPIKTGGALLLAHLARTRGPSTAAVATRGLGRGYLALLDAAPEALGEFGAVIAAQKTPEAKLAMTESFAARFPEFAEMLERLKPQEDSGPASPKSPGERAAR